MKGEYRKRRFQKHVARGANILSAHSFSLATALVYAYSEPLLTTAYQSASPRPPTPAQPTWNNKQAYVRNSQQQTRRRDATFALLFSAGRASRDATTQPHGSTRARASRQSRVGGGAGGGSEQKKSRFGSPFQRTRCLSYLCSLAGSYVRRGFAMKISWRRKGAVTSDGEGGGGGLGKKTHNTRTEVCRHGAANEFDEQR